MNTRKIKPSVAKSRNFEGFRDICQVLGEYYWGDLVGDFYEGLDFTEIGMPILKPVDALPLDLWSFRDGPCQQHPPGCFLHFCCDDFCFECVWKEGRKYKDIIQQNFSGVIGPDFSITGGMPFLQVLYQVYRSRACVWRWQHEGLTAIPFIRWPGKHNWYQFDFITQGLPKGSTLACGSHGEQFSEETREWFAYGMERATEVLQPKRWIVIGGLRDKAFVDRMREKCEVVLYRGHDLRKSRDAFRRGRKKA